MPNWCVGDVKVRGTDEQIVAFLKGALKPMHNYFVAGSIEVREEEYLIEIKTEKGFYLEGCRRHFLNTKSVEHWYEDDKEKPIVFVLEGVEAAWGLDAEGLRQLSEKYQVDIRVYAFERGMEFNQDLEIHKGEIIRFNDITFDDYSWECIAPTLGG